MVVMTNKSWQQSLILRGQRDPVWWISEVLGDRLWSKQEDICYSIVENERTACPACFSDDTEILTETRGFQLFKDLLPTDKVGSYCNGHLVFVYPQAFHVYDYDGDLIGYASEQLNFLITPNHRCLIKNGEQFVEALADSIYGTSAVFCNGFMTIDAPDHGWYKKHYSGKVYCVSVPSGFIYVRRNWIVHVSGNSYGVGKCIPYGESIILANGDVKFVEDLIDKQFTVLAWDSETGKQIPAIAFAEDNGVKKIAKITTNSGRSIARTLNHPLWSAYLGTHTIPRSPITPQFRPIDQLEEGMLVAVPVGLDVVSTETLDASFVKILGYLLGDGSTTVGLSFIQKEGEVLNDFENLITEYGCKLSKVSGSRYNYRVIGINHRENALLDIFRKLKIIGKRAKDKRIPSFMWQADNKSLALLLNRLFACDSWVYVPKDLKRGKATVAITLASEGMIRDIELAMTRLGIYGNVSYGKKRCGDKLFDSWTWQCYRGSEISKFKEIVGIFGKEDKLDEAIAYASKRDPAKQIKWPALNIPQGYVWEKIKSIEYLGESPTVGICVPGYSTYLTTFVEHNTFLAARIALWFLYCFRPAKVISTAPTSRQVRDLLWAELRTAHKKAKVPLGGKPLQLSLTLSTDHFAVGFSTDEDNTDKFTGYHSPNQMVIFDQAAGIPTALWESAEGLMTSANCKWLVISNTAISDSEMANICIPGRKTRFGKWNIIKIRASESPNVVEGRDIYPGLVSFDWVKRRTEAWGKDDPLYKIFIDAEFVESSQMTVVPYQFVQPAFENAGEVDGTIEIGVDVARSGLDSTVFFARSGTKALRIHRLTGHDTMEVVGALVEFVREVEEFYGMPVTAIKIDVIGIGAGVYDRCVELEEIDLPVIAVNNAEKAVVDPDRYLNLRAEQCWNFRRLMETGAVGLADVVVNDLDIMEYLKQDINIMRYKISQSSGKIQIWSKEDLKLILGRSPDYFDSCVLAYCTPGGLVSVEAINTLPTIARQEAGFTVNLTQEEWEVLLGIRVPLDHKSFR